MSSAKGRINHPFYDEFLGVFNIENDNRRIKNVFKIIGDSIIEYLSAYIQPNNEPHLEVNAFTLYTESAITLVETLG